MERAALLDGLTAAPQRAPGRWQIAGVEQIRIETPRTKTFRLRLPAWMPHVPGQHYDVRLTAPDGYRAERSYSIASSPLDEGVVPGPLERVRLGARRGRRAEGTAGADVVGDLAFDDPAVAERGAGPVDDAGPQVGLDIRVLELGPAAVHGDERVLDDLLGDRLVRGEQPREAHHRGPLRRVQRSDPLVGGTRPVVHDHGTH